MVATQYQPALTWDTPIKQPLFGWISVPIQSVFEGGLRLDASVYATEAQKAKQLIAQCKYGAVPLAKLTNECTYPGRFKRAYVSKRHGENFFYHHSLMSLRQVQLNSWLSKKLKSLMR